MNMQGEPRIWTFEELCDSCREMVADMDEKRWLIGDTALVIEASYGEHTTDDFAKNIGIAKSSAYQYRKMSNLYPVDIRARIREDMPNLTYSHLRTGLRFETVDKALVWLEECSANSYSVDEASRKLTEKLGREVHESAEGEIHGYGDFGTYSTITIKVDKHDMEWLAHGGMKVVIRAK